MSGQRAAACQSSASTRIDRAPSRVSSRYRRGVAAEESPRGVGGQVNNSLASRLLLRRPLRARRQSRQQRAAVADRGAQVGGDEGRDGVVAGNQKRFGLRARQRAGEHRSMLFAGDGVHWNLGNEAAV
jgi:hypothetical protein